MMNIEPGKIVLVNFPFTDFQSTKVRPALVLANKQDDLIILGIFSKIPAVLYDSWLIIEEDNPSFKQTGLKKSSVIKTEKITVIHKSLIRKELGSLSPELMQKVKQILRRTLDID